MSTQPTPDADAASDADLEDVDVTSGDVSADSDDSDADSESVEIEHAPPRLAQIVAVSAALIGVGLTAPFTVLAIPFGVAGFALVAASVLSLYSRGWLTAGVGMMLLGALISGAAGALPAELMLVGVGATLIAWDAGQHGIVLGKQLGRQAPSQRNQIVHTASTAIVIGAVSAFAYVVFLIGAAGRPESAVAMAVIGLVVLAWTLRT